MGFFVVKTTLNQRFLKDTLYKWSFHAKKAWIYGLFRRENDLKSAVPYNQSEPTSLRISTAGAGSLPR